MKVKKKKPTSGSVKIKPEIYLEAWDFCETKGIKINFFTTEAVIEKLEKERIKKAVS